jgi:hypothetical protein
MMYTNSIKQTVRVTLVALLLALAVTVGQGAVSQILGAGAPSAAYACQGHGGGC